MQFNIRIAALGVALLSVCFAGTPVAAGGLPRGEPKSHAIPPPEARIDINHATVEEMLKLPGMTRTWAERIVRFRPYRTKLELLEHGVVSDQIYDRIKDYVIAHRDKE